MVYVLLDSTVCGSIHKSTIFQYLNEKKGENLIFLP